MIGIVDYGVGNLFSLKSSFSYIGQSADVISDPDRLAKYDRIILPGVGAFQDAMASFEQSGLKEAVLEHVKAKKPLLGICLGMQMLLETSFEYGEHKGLGLIKGDITPIRDVVPKEYKVPHIGWNSLTLTKPHPLFSKIREGDHVYFVHSYHAGRCDDVIAVTEYGGTLTAAVAKDNVCGTQFHPEKSGEVGLNILRAFLEM